MLTRQTIGLALRDRDLVVVVASVRASSVSWTTTVVPGFLDGGAIPAGLRVPARAPRVLVWPTDALLRREIDIAEQPLDAFREAVGAGLTSFFPLPADESLRWDVLAMPRAATGRSAWIGAVRASDSDRVLESLGAANLAPARIAPSALVLSMLRFTEAIRPVEGEGAPSAVLEVTPAGWSLNEYEALAWTSCRAGAGRPPASILSEARRLGAPMLDWGASDGALSAEHAALAGALLPAASALLGREEPQPFNLLGRSSKRRWIDSPVLRWSAAAAIVVVGLIALARSMAARADRDRDAVLARAEVVAPLFEEVDRLRTANGQLLAAHERLWRLESNYQPRWRTIGMLTESLPADAWLTQCEVFDDQIMLDVVARSAAEVIASLEQSGLFQQVRQVAPATTLESGESSLRVEATFRTDAADTAPSAETAPAAAKAIEARHG